MIHPVTLYMMTTSHTDKVLAGRRAPRRIDPAQMAPSEQHSRLDLKSAKVAALTSLLLALIILLLA
jgi:hypothetical protein